MAVNKLFERWLHLIEKRLETISRDKKGKRRSKERRSGAMRAWRGKTGSEKALSVLSTIHKK